MGTIARPSWAIVIGGASCVWDDVLAWEEMYGQQWDGLVIAANDIGAHWPRELHHWVTLHGPKLSKWKAVRVRQQLPPFRGATWGRAMRMAEQECQLTNHVVSPWAGGSSGMFAAQIARELLCTRVVLCGVPMTPTAHFEQTTEHFHTQWLAAAGHWKGWLRAHDRLNGWCKSMSGRTQELLGAPSHDWLFSTQ